MIYIVLVALAFALVMFPTFRCALGHPFALLWYGAQDCYYYLKRRGFNLCGTGELVAYTGLFGKGKTLSAVHKVVSAYRHYDGKQVWTLNSSPRTRVTVRVWCSSSYSWLRSAARTK